MERSVVSDMAGGLGIRMHSVADVIAAVNKSVDMAHGCGVAVTNQRESLVPSEASELSLMDSVSAMDIAVHGDAGHGAASRDIMLDEPSMACQPQAASGPDMDF